MSDLVGYPKDRKDRFSQVVAHLVLYQYLGESFFIIIIYNFLYTSKIIFSQFDHFT